MNVFARYLDGMVDFGGEVETRAIRLRVVEQWLDHGDRNAECRRHDGRSEHGVHYTQSHTARLDTRLCRIEGVAALQFLDGEAPSAPTAFERLEVRDGATGDLIRDLPLALGWHGMAGGPDGALFAIAKSHRNVLRVDPATGATTVTVPDCAPNTIAVGPDGVIYVHRWSNRGTDPIHAYGADGKLLRTLGRPGGHRPGPWDAEQLENVVALAADRGGSLWVVEGGDYPRRIAQFRADGTFVKEILGNTYYGGGGGGSVNRYRPERAWYGRVEFEVDWAKGRSRVRGILAESLAASDLVAARVAGSPHTYLVSAPHSMEARQAYGIVYLYDGTSGTVRPVAAMGDAGGFGPLRTSQVISKLGGEVPGGFSFVWSDRDGDGKAGPDEVEFTAKSTPSDRASVGRFDNELGCCGPGVRYAVKEFLPGGVPVYERQPLAGSPHLRLDDGSLFTLSGRVPGDEGEVNAVSAAGGDVRWSYPASAGVSGLHIPPWEPGRVTNQFAIIGHETAAAGDLGEFLVIHANTGEWNLWTADGLLAAQVLLHKTHPMARFIGPAEARPGLRLDPLSANQEHFHGFFTRTEPDNRYVIAAGLTHMSLIEVVGLDRFRRFVADVTVTAADLEAARQWEAGRVRGRAQRQERLLIAKPTKGRIAVDGDRAPHEWGDGAGAATAGPASFLIAHDDARLYLCWNVRGVGPFTNSGGEYQRLFKTGAALDLLLGTDPKADMARRTPGRGDLRLLIAWVDGKPQVVLYQPVAPGARPDEAWVARTEAGGETRFDRVVLLNRAEVALKGESDFTVEAAIPLADLGLKIQPGLELAMDWGVLTSADGHQVKERLYWANTLATGTSDEAVEARLEPHLWGRLRFTGETAVEDALEQAAPSAIDEALDLDEEP